MNSIIMSRTMSIITMGAMLLFEPNSSCITLGIHPIHGMRMITLPSMASSETAPQ